MFIDKYLVRNEFSKVSIIGSYGFYNQDLLKKLLLKNNLLLNNCVQYPIERLTDYIEKSTL